MINKFYKTIHNKYSTFFRFIFFLRYLLGLFVASTVLFFLIPNFFNYEKGSEIFKKHLVESYDLEILQFEKIEFNSFPLPNLELNNVLINIHSSSIELKVKKLKIFPKILSIYNYQNFETKKIVLKNSEAFLETVDLKLFVKKLFSQKNNFHFDDLSIKINENTKSLLSLENIQFKNFGYKKNIVEGNIFNKKFKAQINDNLNNINFKLLKSGLNIDINLNDTNNKNFINGLVRLKLLNTNLKFDFRYGNNSLKIYNSFFRNKNISFKNESLITLKPFLYSSSKFDIEEVDVEIFKELKIDQILKFKNVLKQINSTNNEIRFNSKKFSRSLINKLNLKYDLAYGRLNYSKKMVLSDDIFQCEGNVNLLEEFPLLFFNCSIHAKSKRKFLKKFNIFFKRDNEPFILNAKGNLSILNQKVNFKNISMNKNYNASREDLDYFKEKFENTLFNENFVGIFNLKKIKEFILEIS